MGDPWDDERRKCWRAVYGASVARQVHDWLARGEGPPSEAHWDGIHEEAQEIAGDAVTAGDRAKSW